ncbi:MAG TPA: TIGR04222 domain-containing membrane protein [Terriglobales bacterium]|nr:TIGR04222 domain-containing membrane protein [Terriglobales bacterium]
MINPLDLPGPPFLLFYSIVGALVLGVVWLMQTGSEGGPAPRLDMSDPYIIAFLRGGAEEAARVATVSLIDRGVLVANNAYLLVARGERGRLTPLEQAIVASVAPTASAMRDVLGSPRVAAACVAYETALKRHALIPNDAMRAERRRRRLAALAILLGLAGAKIVVALSRGRANIAVLIVLAIGFAIAALVITSRFRTARGTALLNDLRRLFERLRARAPQFAPGRATADVALLTAVFGVGALPVDRFPYVRRLFPRANGSSSCGSSSGGCGGGGGGGGCGGCGGGGD